MDAHIREAGAEAPIALAEQIAAARMLEHGITKERLPFVYGWHRLIVSAPTRELCVRRVEAVVEHYRDIGIDIVNSTGDQFSLLSESLPGDRIRLKSYVQRQPLYTIAGGMPTATVGLGDRPDAGAAGSGRISGRRWAGRGRLCILTRWWPRPGTGRLLSLSLVSRVGGRPRWLCCSFTSWRCVAPLWR